MTKARLRILWLLPVAFALHELEEWNILRWYHENWTNMQPEQMSPAIVQAWLGFITLLGFAWTFVGTRLPNPRLAAHVVMFFFMFLPFGHTVAHLYWLVDLGEYHPGVVTAIALIIPVTLYVGTQLVRQRLVSFWYLGLVFLLTLPQSLGAIGMNYRIPDDGLPHYRLSAWLVSLVT